MFEENAPDIMTIKRSKAATAATPQPIGVAKNAIAPLTAEAAALIAN